MKASVGLNIVVAEDYDEMSKIAAELVAGAVAEKPDAVLGLATGGTPMGLYKELVGLHRAGAADFSRITTFNLDEYYPIQKTNEQSYSFFMNENLFNHINVDFGRVHIPDGEAKDPEAECAAYEARIAAGGSIDLQVLGLGVNGHIGFNEPADCFSAATSLVNLTQSTIDANKRFFESEAQVPRQALTMGVKTIMMARRILMLASGGAKADIVRRFIRGPVTPQVPASALQLHRRVTVVLDRAAAAGL